MEWRLELAILSLVRDSDIICLLGLGLADKVNLSMAISYSNTSDSNSSGIRSGEQRYANPSETRIGAQPR